MEEKMLDIVKMSSDLGISKSQLRRILGIESKSGNGCCGCSVSNIIQIKAMYAEALPGSNEEQAILERWNELSMIEINKAKTVQEMRIAHDESPLESEARDVSASFWNEMSLEQVQTANNYRELLDAYRNAPFKSEARRLAINKLAEFYKQ